MAVNLGNLISTQGTVNFPGKQACSGNHSAQPLIDNGLQRDIALQPVGFPGKVERLFGMHRAEHQSERDFPVGCGFYRGARQAMHEIDRRGEGSGPPPR